MSVETLSTAFSDRLSGALTATAAEKAGLSIEDQHQARWNALAAVTASVLAIYWVRDGGPDEEEVANQFAADVEAMLYKARDSREVAAQ